MQFLRSACRRCLWRRRGGACPAERALAARPLLHARRRHAGEMRAFGAKCSKSSWHDICPAFVCQHGHLDAAESPLHRPDRRDRPSELAAIGSPLR